MNSINTNLICNFYIEKIAVEWLFRVEFRVESGLYWLYLYFHVLQNFGGNTSSHFPPLRFCFRKL